MQKEKKYTGKVLVTGGTGFIGSFLVEELVKQGRDVRVLALKVPIEPIETENLILLKKLGVDVVYGDLRDVSSLRKAMVDVEVVFHLGALSRPMAVSNHEYYDVNVRGTENILEVAKEFNIKKFIHTSTVSVLGLSPDGHPLLEEEFQYNDLQYGLTKREGERIALFYNYKHKLPVVIIRPSLVYGPRCLVRLVMFKFVKLGLFPLFNHGNAHMEFVYVDNVVQALLLAEENDDVVGEVFNITDGKPYKIKNILNTIADTLEVKHPRINIPTKLGYYLGIVAEIISGLFGSHPSFSRSASDWMSHDVNVYSCDKAKKLLNYSPKINLKEGISKTVFWYKERNLL